MTTKKKDTVHRCQYTHDSFKVHKGKPDGFRHDGTNQCWMTKTRKYSGLKVKKGFPLEQHLCIFHMPEHQEDEKCQKLQSSTLKNLINEWNADEEKNSFLMPGMRCGEISFTNVTFKSDLNFSQATFSDDAWFVNATFSGAAWFGEATFSDIAMFYKATFSGDARFREANFSGAAWFEKATFSDDALFGKATFSDDALFGKATFSDDAVFDKAEISHGPKMQQCKFKKAPSFHDVTISQSADFRGAEFRDKSSRDAATNYRTLKVAMNKASNKKQEAIFYGLEQKSLRRQPESSVVERLFSWLYEKFSNYGQSILRPLVWLLIVNVFFGFVYSLIKFPMSNIFSYVSTGFPDFLNKISILIKFVTINIVSPFKVWTTDYVSEIFGEKIETSREVMISIIATFQSIITLIIITLLILAVRRNFKLN